MAARPKVVRRTRKTKSDSCSRGLGNSKKKKKKLILPYFDENPIWQSDDVIP